MALPDDPCERQRARQERWLEWRLAELVAEHLAALPSDLRALRLVVESAEQDAAIEACAEFLRRFRDEPKFRQQFTCDT